jgi:two-component system OmpR family sensor kinase
VSLRSRLLTVLVSLTAVGLVVAGIATYASLRSFLIDRVDRTVAGNATALARSLEVRGHLDPGDVDALGASNPGVYIGLAVSGQQLRWAPIGVRIGETPPPRPDLPVTRAAGAEAGEHPFTVPAVSGGSRFRVQLERLAGGQTLVVAAPLNDVQDTLHQLLLVEIVVALSVLLAIFLAGLWLVRVGLRPLGRIEQTAAAIAGGDLSQRIENDDPRTEVGRLGGALNTMLGQIEQAFAERTASEQRLRRFVADASHELRTPLAAVSAYAELFDRGARERPDDLERAMTGIQRESHRMGLLVDDLLLLARLDQGRPLEQEPVELSEVAREAVEAARAVDPGRPLDLDAPAPVEVVGDRERLRQIVDNLLSNVRAHTPAGAPATVRVTTDGARAVAEVADSGPGLSSDQLAHAFERFYRGDPSRSRDAGGVGLGLAIAAAIAESHGGEATVVNEGCHDGPGFTVRVTIPLAAAVLETLPAAEEATIGPAPT